MNLLEEKLQLLSEELSSTVYHATDIISLYSMLTGKGFKLSDVEDSGLKRHPVNTEKYKYYMSTARSMNSEYVKGYINHSSGIIIEFDGKKLSERYKGRAVDWYAQKTAALGGVYYSEAEDRLYSKTSVIPNIEKYIKAVHILSYFKNRASEEFFNKVKKLERNFPIYIYNKKKDIRFLRRDKAEKV